MLLKSLDRWLTNHNWRVIINAAQAKCTHIIEGLVLYLALNRYRYSLIEMAVESASTGQKFYVTLYVQSSLYGSMLLSMAECSTGSGGQVSEKELINY